MFMTKPYDWGAIAGYASLALAAFAFFAVLGS